MAKGKLVDTWYYEYKGVVSDLDKQVIDPEDEDEGVEPVEPPKTVKGVKVAIRVYIMKDFNKDQEPPQETKQVWFQIECDCEDPSHRKSKSKDARCEKQDCQFPKFKFAGPDIEALRTAMWSKLAPHFRIRWENWLKVEVTPGWREYQETVIHFKYETVEKGIAWDGTELLREYQYGADHKITPWPGVFKGKNGKVLALIPETEANLAALSNFSKKIEEMREMLADFLKPERIMETLMYMGGLNLIAGPSDTIQPVDTEPIETNAEVIE